MKLKPFIKSENYDYEYGKLDYRNKRVLDLGADYGSTAEYFLEKGAIEVVAVEGHKVLYGQLVENCKWLKNVIPVFLFITEPKQISELIEKYKPDIIKSDLDGYEIHLLKIPDIILSSVNEYTLEIHSMELLNMSIEKFLGNGYQIVEFKKLDEKKASTGLFFDGVLITFVKPKNSPYYFGSMKMLFKYWKLSKKEGINSDT